MHLRYATLSKGGNSTTVTWRRAPLRATQSNITGACVFTSMGKKCCFVICSGVSYCYFRTIENNIWFARYCLKVDVSKTWFMCGRSVLSGREWWNLVMKGTFDLCCTARTRWKSVGDAWFGTGQEANIGSRFYYRMMTKEHHCFYYCAVVS